MKTLGILKSVLNFIEKSIPIMIFATIAICIVAFFLTGAANHYHLDRLAEISNLISMISAISFCAFVLIAWIFDRFNS